jgi:enoyl-CoA hydratase
MSDTVPGAVDDVRLERDGPVAVITIDRPASRNAVGLATMGLLGDVVADVAGSDAALVVLRGAGDRVFVSGGDLKELAALRTVEDAQAMARRMRTVLDALAGLPVPVLAALNGDAYGGGAEVAVACDVRLAADDVRLGFTQVQLGIMPAWGGIERLGALVGRGRALYLLASGRVLGAGEAATWGLVEEVAPRARFEDRWRALAHELAGASGLALRGIKGCYDAAHPPARPDLAEGATAAFARTWVSDDHWSAVERADRDRRARRS